MLGCSMVYFTWVSPFVHQGASWGFYGFFRRTSHFFCSVNWIVPLEITLKISFGATKEDIFEGKKSYYQPLIFGVRWPLFTQVDLKLKKRLLRTGPFFRFTHLLISILRYLSHFYTILKEEKRKSLILPLLHSPVSWSSVFFLVLVFKLVMQ